MILNIVSSTSGGGAELLVRELHKAYLDHGLDAHAIYLSGDEDSLSRNESVLGINPRNPLNILKIRKTLKLIPRNEDASAIVHVHLTWPLYYVTLAALGIENLRLIYTEHDTTNSRRRLPFLRALERKLYERYTHVICISEGVRSSLAHWVGPEIARRLITISNGSRIYRMVERRRLEGRLPRLVSIGSLSRKKNFSTTINAVAEMRDEIDEYIIIGEGPERKRLEHIIKLKKMEKKVKLLGWKNALETYLQAADIQLIPSLWEGFGLVAVEGMSTGLPVVASNVDGLREVLGEANPSTNLVNQPDSVNEWVIRIQRTVSSIQSRGWRYISDSSRRQAEKFSFDRMATAYLALYYGGELPPESEG